MRIREGNYGYDLEQAVDPQTQLRLNWRYTIYRLYPTEQVLETGEAPTRAAAETKARAAVNRIEKKQGKSAA